MPAACRHLDLSGVRIAERDHLGQEERITAGGADDLLADFVRNGVTDERARLLLW